MKLFYHLCFSIAMPYHTYMYVHSTVIAALWLTTVTSGVILVWIINIAC